MGALELDGLAALGQHANALRVRPVRAHDDLAPPFAVGAEQVVRVGVVALDDLFDFESSCVGLLE